MNIPDSAQKISDIECPKTQAIMWARAFETGKISYIEFCQCCTLEQWVILTQHAQTKDVPAVGIIVEQTAQEMVVSLLSQMGKTPDFYKLVQSPNRPLLPQEKWEQLFRTIIRHLRSLPEIIVGFYTSTKDMPSSCIVGKRDVSLLAEIIPDRIIEMLNERKTTIKEIMRNLPDERTTPRFRQRLLERIFHQFVGHVYAGPESSENHLPNLIFAHANSEWFQNLSALGSSDTTNERNTTFAYALARYLESALNVMSDQFSLMNAASRVIEDLYFRNQSIYGPEGLEILLSTLRKLAKSAETIDKCNMVLKRISQTETNNDTTAYLYPSDFQTEIKEIVSHTYSTLLIAK